MQSCFSSQSVRERERERKKEKGGQLGLTTERYGCGGGGG